MSRRRSSMPVTYGSERPASRSGGVRRTSLDQQPPPTPSTSPSMRPTSSRGSRRGSMEFSSQDLMITPSPPPRPPSSSQRPKSRYRNRSNTRAMSQDSGVFDQSEQTGYPDVSSRPSTASSLNRYTPLPPIGQAGDTDNMDDVTNATQQMHLDDKSNMESPRTIYRSDKQGTAGRRNSNDSKVDKGITSANTNTPNNKTNNKSNNSKEELNNTNNKQISENRTREKVPENVQKSDGDIIEEESLYKPLKRKISLPPEASESDERVVLAVKLPDGQRIQRGFRCQDKLRVVLEFAEVSAQLDLSSCHLVCNMPKQVFSDLNMSIKQSGLQDRTVLHIEIPDD